MSDIINSLTTRTIVRQTPNQVSAEMGDETAVLDVDTGYYYGLNESSSEIWDYIEEPRKIADICSFLYERFEISADQCEREVLNHLVKLVEDGLVEIIEEDVG